MSKVYDGGSAFPEPSNAQCGGMTLRDYFIAHAPAEPQKWFKPKMAGERPESPGVHDVLTEAQFKIYQEYWEWPEDCPDPEVKSFLYARQEAYDAANLWDKEKEKQRYIQWPAAWADAMLKARES